MRQRCQASDRTNLGDFLRATDLELLSDELIAEYDRAPAGRAIHRECGESVHAVLQYTGGHGDGDGETKARPDPIRT
jgi:hypothetical protein